MKSPEQYAPQQINEIEKSRVISDADFLKEGAEYKTDQEGNSRLELTDEQFEEIYKEMESDLEEKNFLLNYEKINEERCRKALEEKRFEDVERYSKRINSFNRMESYIVENREEANDLLEREIKEKGIQIGDEIELTWVFGKKVNVLEVEEETGKIIFKDYDLVADEDVVGDVCPYPEKVIFKGIEEGSICFDEKEGGEKGFSWRTFQLGGVPATEEGINTWRHLSISKEGKKIYRDDIITHDLDDKKVKKFFLKRFEVEKVKK